MSIRILPSNVANKIAAGEVIERPASVVKELVENSLDAEAGRIEVDLEDGGARLIRVVDDGRGIPEEDLPLAFAGHATSKLTSEEDLFDISTMGFRGEALASIGSVSHARIASRTPDSDSGHEIEMEEGVIGSVRACGAPVGTQVEVRNLFANVPVRKKFLKTTATEMAHITEAVTRLALVRPDIHFALTHKGRKVYNLPPAESSAQRIGEFFGREIADNLIPVEWENERLRVGGYLLPPDIDRRNTRMQYTYVNGRYIRNKTLMHAISQAYQGMITSGRRPVCFLFIRLDPGTVDVNVHPTKLEVRFRSANEIHQAAVAAMRDALREAKITPQVALQAAEAGETQQAVRRAIGDFFASSGPAQGSGEVRARPRAGGAGAAAQRPEGRPPPQRVQVRFGNCVQMLDSYLIEETDEGLNIIDQHALHERLLYNEIEERLKEGPLYSQRLLVPELVELPRPDFYTVMDLQEDLGRFGMEIEAFGDQTVIVRAFPQILGKFDGKSFFEDLLSEVEGGEERRNVDGRLERLVRMMACRAAVKAGQRLSPEQIKSILRKRSEYGPADTCPHGRPTTITLSRQKLDRQFRRT